MIVEPAPAKINLALHVRSRRDDGYHEIETLFAFLQDGDEVRLADGPASFAVEGPFAGALAGEGDNLVTRAARAYAEAFARPDMGAFVLMKRLPVASGIGGGSADAAAALRALARRDGVPLDDPRLFVLADALGSDVPACLLRPQRVGARQGRAARAGRRPGRHVGASGQSGRRGLDRAGLCCLGWPRSRADRRRLAPRPCPAGP